MKKTTLLLTATALVASIASSSNAAVLASYEFNSDPTSTNGANLTVLSGDLATTPEFQATTTATNVSASAISIGSGVESATFIGDPANANRNSFQLAEGNGLSDGTDDDIEGAFTAGDYVEFSITALAGTTLDLNSFTFDLVRGDRGAQDYAFRTNVDGGGFSSTFGFADQSIPGITLTDGTPNFTPNAGINHSLDLSGAAYQGLTSFTIQIALDDRVNNTAGASGTVFDTFVVNGDVVPEPSSITLLGLGMAGLLMRRRRA
ncbi:MAG: PEP-CTERM sorting domain-containing protein [Luteolibacter sp.]